MILGRGGGGGAGSYTSGGGYVMWRASSCESKGPEQGEPAPVGAWGLPQPQYCINKQSFDGNITPNPLYILGYDISTNCFKINWMYKQII